jgi:hypothetical protein
VEYEWVHSERKDGPGKNSGVSQQRGRGFAMESGKEKQDRKGEIQSVFQKPSRQRINLKMLLKI